MLTGLINGLIMAIARMISFKLMLKKSRVPEGATVVDTFIYKGKVYDRTEYIKLKSEKLQKQSAKSLMEMIDQYNRDVAKSKMGKHPELYTINIEATKAALSQIEK